MTAALLSARLRAGTASAHAQAEASPFFAALAAGAVTRGHVAALAARLLPVYQALERAAERWAGDPAVQQLLVPGPVRSARLQADLAALGSRVDARSPASAAYVERVAVTASRRTCFVAHHYVRYLGDLSGGQVVRRALHGSLGLDADDGAAFYAFEDDCHPAAVTTAYRAALDALPLTADEQAEVVDEALVAYRLNTALGRELNAVERPSPR